MNVQQKVSWAFISGSPLWKNVYWLLGHFTHVTIKKRFLFLQGHQHLKASRDIQLSEYGSKMNMYRENGQ